MSRGILRIGAASAACAAGVLGAAEPAGANIVKAFYINGSNWSYEIKHVPDFDQKRTAGPGGVIGLPGDGGMHCVPTSAVNMFAYVANHGYPFVAPEDMAWWNYDNPSIYNQATFGILVMGILMGTTPEGGTNGSGAEDGAQDWLGVWNETLFDVDFYWFGNGLSPTASNIGLLACTGSLVNPCYGYYTKIGDVGGVPIIKRGGGHCVSFVKGDWAGSSGVLWVRDPADVGYDSVQNAYTSRKLYANDELVFVNDVFTPRVMTRVKGDPSDTSYRYIDGMLKIRLKWGLTWQPDEQPPKIKFEFPNKLKGGAGLVPQDLELPGGVIKDLVMTPLEDGVYAIVKGDISTLQLIEPLTGDVQEIADVAQASKMSIAPLGLLYLLDPENRELICVNPNLDAPKQQTAKLPFPPTDTAYNPVMKEVAVLSVNTNKLLLHIPEKIEEFSVWDLPADLPVGGDAEIQPDPTDGDYWIKTDVSPRLFKVRLTATAGLQIVNAFEVPGCDPVSFRVDENGQLVISCDGSVKVYKPEQIPGGPVVYTENPDSAFHDLPSDGVFVPTVGQTNHDPEIHTDDAFLNIHADDLDPVDDDEFEIDCITDLNDDEVTDSADLNILLAEFATGFLGDCDGDGDTDSADLNLLLAAFGDDCP